MKGLAGSDSSLGIDTKQYFYQTTRSRVGIPLGSCKTLHRVYNLFSALKNYSNAVVCHITLQFIRRRHKNQLALTCYLYPFAHTGKEYIRVPKPKEGRIVIAAYTCALQECLV